MQIRLTVEECKLAIANYVNSQKILNGVQIEPKHLNIEMRSEGDHDERQDVFVGITIDVPCSIVPTPSFLPDIRPKKK